MVWGERGHDRCFEVETSKFVFCLQSIICGLDYINLLATSRPSLWLILSLKKGGTVLVFAILGA